MSTYKEIIGQKITKVSADPGDPKTGQMWYNSTTGTLRGLGILEAWSSASPLSRTSSGGYYGSIGTSTSSLALVGTPGNSSPLETEEWNGTGWSASDNMAPYPGIAGNMTPQGGASGTVTSALYSGGEQYTGNTENKAQEYNGSSWTAITNTPVKTGYNVGIGAASDTSMSVGGYDETYAFLTNTLNWNGSAWTAGGSLSTARWAACGGGTNTAAWFSGGKTGSYPGTNTTATENYNGTAWSSGDALNTSRKAAAGSGPQTASIVSGGETTPGPRLANTEVYNGTAWTETADLSTARGAMRGNAGTSAGAFIGGGSAPPQTSATEEFNKSTNTITAAAWASGGAMNTARNYMFGVGSQTAALGAAGYLQPFTPTTNSEEYNGTSWTEGNNLTTGRYAVGGFGTQTSAVAVGGDTRPPGGTQFNTTVEEYDGTNWTAGTAYPVAINFIAGAGSETAGVAFGGGVPGGPRTAQTTEYNGSAWTTSAPQNLNTARSSMGSAGTQTAAIGFSGSEPAASNKTETYDGSTWTVGGTLINSGLRNSLGGGPALGSTTNVLASGGPPPTGSKVEGYDGTSWSTRPSIATARSGHNGAGDNSSGIVYGGATPSYTTATEEFTGETSAANITDFTTS